MKSGIGKRKEDLKEEKKKTECRPLLFLMIYWDNRNSSHIKTKQKKNQLWLSEPHAIFK